MSSRRIVLVLRAALLGLAWMLANPSSSHALAPLPARVIELGRQDDPLVRAGYLPITFYDVDPTGHADSTAGINRAILDARESGLITYVPAGTYLISDSLVGIQRYQLWNCADHFDYPLAGEANIPYGTGMPIRKAPSLVGPSTGPRPILRLVDHAPGFGDPSNPRPMIHMFNNGPGYGYEPAWWGQFDCAMGIHIRNLELQLGDGNPGAVGIEAPMAQWSTMQNLRVVATGGYAGFRGLVQTRVAMDLEVIGGRYGIVLPLGSESLVGAHLADQEEAAVVVSAYSPALLVGVEIEKESAPAIVIDYSGVISGPQSSQLTLVDSRIQIRSGGGPVIANNVAGGSGRSLALFDVWISGGSGALVQSGSSSLSRLGGAWNHIVDYVYADAESTSSVTTRSIVDGATLGAPDAHVESAALPPSDLRSRHVVQRAPAFDDARVLSVQSPSIGARGDGMSDDTAALQRAIDSSDYVFLPTGDYRISSTLRLRATTHLFGIPGGRSRIVSSGLAGSGYRTMIETADDANATTYVSDVQLMLPGDNTIEALLWRAGPQSVLTEFYADIPWTTDHRGSERALARFRGNAGGRIYGLQLFQQYDGASDNPAHRTLLIDGTRAPLTFYGGNSEYSNAPMVEVRGARNVRFLGGNKTEVRHTFLTLQDSFNIMHTGTSGHCQFDFGVTCNPGRPGNFDMIVLRGGGDILLANEAMYRDTHHMRNTLVDEGVTSMDGSESVGVYRRGSFDVSVFPHCGDAACDAHTESSLSCPSDCTGAGPVCGDALCSATESCETCASDCPCPVHHRVDACATDALSVDASSGDWSMPAWFSLGALNAVIQPSLGIASAPSSDADLSARIGLAWDATYLYAVVEVVDDDVQMDSALVFQDDGVEFYFDGLGQAGSAYDADDWQYSVSANGREGGVRGAPVGATSAAMRTARGYIVEVRVPWSALGGAPSSGRTLGFDVAINDDDGGGDRESQIAWAGNGYGFRDPSVFGTARMDARSCAMALPDAGGLPDSGVRLDAGMVRGSDAGTPGSMSGHGSLAGGCTVSHRRSQSMLWVLAALGMLVARKRRPSRA